MKIFVVTTKLEYFLGHLYSPMFLGYFKVKVQSLGYAKISSIF